MKNLVIRCKIACVTIQNMGIYDRCEKDVKNCRPHALKPEIRIFFFCLSAFILNQRGQNHKYNENAGSLYMKQFTS